MYSIISRIACNLKPLAIASRLKDANHISHNCLTQLNRSYKNFGHSRDEHSKLTFLWTALLFGGMIVGCLRGLT